MADDFATFRAAHPSLLDAIAACDRPEWLVELAWEATDHETAVSIGLGAAQLSSAASDTLALFKPNPDRLETVAAWTGDASETDAFARSVVLASVPAVVLGYAVVALIMPGAWLAYVGAILALELGFAMVLRRWLAAIVRRRAAQLDDRAALAIVLDEIRKGTAATPQRVPIVLQSTRNRLRRVLAATG
jgi:hypothetical protein